MHRLRQGDVGAGKAVGAALAVGTRPMIQDKVTFKELVLASIDEQHRFGVAPRLLDQHPLLAEKHVQRWLGGKAEFLKA